MNLFLKRQINPGSASRNLKSSNYIVSPVKGRAEYDFIDIMMRKSSDIKAAVDKLNKLKALQAKATDKLDKITVKAGGKAPKKKVVKPTVKRKPAAKKKTKTPAKKESFWKRVFGGKGKGKKARRKR